MQSRAAVRVVSATVPAMRSWLLATAVVVATARLIAAAPLAQLSADVDGDGTLDQVSVGSDGVLAVHTGHGATVSVALGAGVTTATLAVAQVVQKPLIVARLSKPSGDEAVIASASAHGVTIAWRGPVGGVGLDAEYAVEVQARTTGVVKFEQRFGWERCDGKPADLFAEWFDGAGFHRRTPTSIDVADSAPKLTARADTGANAPPVVYQARAASREPGATNAGDLGLPHELDDGKLDTGWRTSGAFRGEFFTFVPRIASAQARELRIVPQSPSDRLHELAIVSKSGAWRVELPDAAREPAGTAFVVTLPEPVAGCVSVVLDSAYPGAHEPLGLAELEVFADGERSGAGGDALLAAAVAAGGDGARVAAAALARHGAVGATAIAAELTKTTDRAARGRLGHALVADKDPAAAALLVKLVAEGALDGGDLLDAIAALGDNGQTEPLAALVAKRDLAIDVRIAAVKALTKSPAALVELAGSGPRALRRAEITALTRAPIETLVSAAHADTRPSGAGDLWRAVTERAHATVGDRPVALAAMLGELPASTDYERRYRLVDGVATLGDAAALVALGKLLAEPRSDSEAAALKRIAAGAIANNPRPEAFDLVVALAGDRDPGVRLAALAAIASADGSAAGPWHAAGGDDAVDRVLESALAKDAWPEVRRRAALSLGARCTRTGPAQALTAALGRDPEAAVRVDALVALVGCNAPDIAAVLARLWDDAKAPIELRRRAIELAVTLGDHKLGTDLVVAFERWRRQSLESTAALALGQSAAYAIGELRPDGAAASLAAALDETAFPEIVSAAANALGRMGSACPASAKTKLADLARSEEPQISAAAKHAAAVCGK